MYKNLHVSGLFSAEFLLLFIELNVHAIRHAMHVYNFINIAKLEVAYQALRKY